LLLGTTVAFSQSNYPNSKDYLAIQNELAKWNQMQDDGNLEGFMGLWAESPTFKNPFGEFKSREEIKGFEQNYLNGFANGKRHLASNVAIMSSGKNTALAKVDLMVVEVKEIPYIAATVRAYITLVKESGIWKFKEVVLWSQRLFSHSK
jgi:hypothetical protein